MSQFKSKETSPRVCPSASLARIASHAHAYTCPAGFSLGWGRTDAMETWSKDGVEESLLGLPQSPSAGAISLAHWQ